MKTLSLFLFLSGALCSTQLQAQGFRSPLTFRIFQEFKKVEKLRLGIDACGARLEKCNEYYLRTTEEGTHEDYVYTRMDEYYNLEDFPVGVMDIIEEFETPQSIIDLIESNKNLEISYFYGATYTDKHIEYLVGPGLWSCLSIRDREYDEIVFACR